MKKSANIYKFQHKELEGMMNIYFKKSNQIQNSYQIFYYEHGINLGGESPLWRCLSTQPNNINPIECQLK